jgi:DMSO/TMAO reductase YedYZ heme-binding membrane subunit
VQAVVLTGVTAGLVFFAIQTPTTERLWWAAAFVILSVLIWFLTSREIQKLQHEYRYEDDLNATD